MDKFEFLFHLFQNMKNDDNQSTSISENIYLIVYQMLVLAKKYKDQEPPYLMRQICLLQWEEIKTKNSGATHHF